MSIKSVALQKLKSLVFARCGIPYSPDGLPGPLVERLPKSVPINLVDVGASSGEFCHSVLRHCGIKQAVLIEPLKHRALELKARFPGDRFLILDVALSSKDGCAEMHVHNFDYTSSLLPIKSDVGRMKDFIDVSVKERYEVNTQRLDTLLKNVANAEHIDLLKLDIQGAELLALEGAAETLKHTRFIWTEVSFVELYSGACTFQEIFDFLSNCGFSLVDISGGFRGSMGELLQADALFQKFTD